MKRLRGDGKPLALVQRFEGDAITAAHSGRELGRLLVTLDQRPLDFLFIGEAIERQPP